MLQLKLVTSMRGTPLACVVWHHIKVVHFSPGCGAYPNIDEEMITAPIVEESLNLKMTEETLHRAYLSHQIDTFKIDNAMVYKILSKDFTDIDAYIYMKQRKAMQDGHAMYFKVHKHFLGTDHMARQATEAKGKLHKSNYDWREKDMGLGQICCPPQRTACHYGKSYRLWLHWYGHWNKAQQLALRH